MRKCSLPAALGLAACQAAPPIASLVDTSRREGEVVVRLRTPSGVGNARSAVDGRLFVPLTDVETLRWVGNVEGARTLEAGGAIVQEPVVHHPPELVPSDTRFRGQWALADIGAPAVWDKVRSAKGVVFTVVNSGVMLHRPDLASAFWTNEDEVPGNGLDDDGNGFVYDVHGWDLVECDVDPSPGGNEAFVNHGSHATGTTGAFADTGCGFDDVASMVRVKPVRTMSGRGGRSEWIANGLLDALPNEPKDINLSLDGVYSRHIDKAVSRACRAGAVVVAAAGIDNAPQAPCPAPCELAGVITVVATDDLGQFTPSSNDGPGVNVNGPGVDLFSPFGVRAYRGTSRPSMAAPPVSGALTLRFASRGARGFGDVPSRLASLSGVLTDSPRYDLPSLMDDAPADGQHITSRRTRMTFHTDSGRRRPPPRILAIEADAPVMFDVETESWVHVGKCREAPCRLSISVDPSLLGFGAHEAPLVLHPHDGSADLQVTITLLVGVGADEASFIEADRSGREVPAVKRIALPGGSPVILRRARGGHPASAHGFVDGVSLRGDELRGVFRLEPHHVEAVDDLGRPVVTEVVVQRA